MSYAGSRDVTYQMSKLLETISALDRKLDRALQELDRIERHLEARSSSTLESGASVPG